MTAPEPDPPEDLPTAAFRGADIARSSDGLGWSAVGLEHRVTPRGGDMERPIAFDSTLLIVHRRRSAMWQEMDGRAREVAFRPGDALLLPRGCPVRWRWRGPADTAVVALPGLAAGPVPVLTDWSIALAAEWLLREMASPVPAGRLLADALGLRIAAGLAAPPRARAPESPLDDRRLRAATERLAAGPEGPANMAELAASVGLSPAHFARAFRARTGVPPHAWLRALRVARVLGALRRPGAKASLAELAADSGFADQAHMTREVRRATGFTPGALRA